MLRSIELTDFEKWKLKEARMTEAELLKTYRYGEQQAPNRYTKSFNGYIYTVIVRRTTNEGWFELKACWKNKISEWMEPKLYK